MCCRVSRLTQKSTSRISFFFEVFRKDTKINFKEILTNSLNPFLERRIYQNNIFGAQIQESRMVVGQCSAFLLLGCKLACSLLQGSGPVQFGRLQSSPTLMFQAYIGFTTIIVFYILSILLRTQSCKNHVKKILSNMKLDHRIGSGPLTSLCLYIEEDNRFQAAMGGTIYIGQR